MSADKDVASKETLLRQVGALALVGGSYREIAKKLNITEDNVKRIQKTSEYKDYIKRLADETVATAKNLYRAQLVGMQHKVVRIMHELLDSDSKKDKIEGIKLFYRGIGLDEVEQQQGDTNLVINLPGMEQKIVNAEKGDIEDATNIQDGSDF